LRGDKRVRLSVIIPALNEAASIGRAVDSAWQAGAAEVLVADGGSVDQTAAIAEGHGATLVSAPLGRGVQQNEGAKRAAGDVLLFLHADNWLDGPIAKQITAAFNRSSRLHGALRQRIDADGITYRLLERGNAERVRWLGLPYGDQAIFVCRNAFVAAGGFPEVSLMEDVILMQRLRRLAWPALLEGPVHVSPRRWQKQGLVRQTIRNRTLLAALALGVSPERLAGYYRRHDE
jgi:rSAM/selenodomain-associated transferase 2